MNSRGRVLQTSILAVALLAGFAPGAARAGGNILFILDSSNSMWGQVNGTAKMQVAKEALASLLKDLSADTKVGLMAYGHRSEGDCRDVETLSGIGQDTPADLIGKLNGLTPKGKTPISFSLEKSAAEFAGLGGQNNNVVLVSDGIETCAADPCQVAAKLAAEGVGVRVHVVGFDVDAEARAQLECIAEKGNGRYFDAKDTAGLTQAVAEVSQETQLAQAAPTPAPAPAPTLKEYFFDDFDGGDLAEHWEIVNPNPDSFIVENGKLLVLSGKTGSLNDETVENVFKLTTPLPAGDWTATMKVEFSFQTIREYEFLGLYKDKGNHILAVVLGDMRLGMMENPQALVVAMKTSNGETTSFAAPLHQGEGTGLHGKAWAESLPKSHYLRMQKQGRNFIVSANYSGAEDKWTTLDKLTSLRSDGALALGLTQTGQGQGESLMYVDWVRIEAPE